MDRGLTASPFPTTIWEELRATNDPKVLSSLLSRYWAPVYAFLRRQGHRPGDAADLTQSFLIHVLEKDLISRADRSRGRFRSLLLTALHNYVIDQIRTDHANYGDSGIQIPTDPHVLADAEPSAHDDPSTAFERQWAAATLDTAIDRTRDSAARKGMQRQWEAFEARILRPLRHGVERESVESLMSRLPARTPQEIYSMLQTIERNIRREIEDVVAETVERREVDAELAALKQYLHL